MDDEERGVWVNSELVEGKYRLYIEQPDGGRAYLDGAAGMAWAAEVMRALVHAEFDASVYKQLTGDMGLSDQDAGVLVMDTRADRAPYQSISAIAGLRLVPGVSAFTGEAFLQLLIGNKQVGQWTPNDARQHVLGVLEATLGVEQDNTYLRALRTMGLSEREAALMVANLPRSRVGWHVASD